MCKMHDIVSLLEICISLANNYLWYEAEYYSSLVIKQEMSPKLYNVFVTCWKVQPPR